MFLPACDYCKYLYEDFFNFCCPSSIIDIQYTVSMCVWSVDVVVECAAAPIPLPCIPLLNSHSLSPAAELSEASLVASAPACWPTASAGRYM